MTISNHKVNLGKGRLSSAAVRNNENVFYIAVSGGIIEKKLHKDFKQVYGGKIVSYQDDFFYCHGTYIERRGDTVYAIFK